MSDTDSSLLQFPCDFLLKIMGRADAEFEVAALQIVHRHCADLGENAVRQRASSGGKYLSLSISVRAHSRQQLDALYTELSAHPAVLMVL